MLDVNGSLFFTDPPYGLKKGDQDPLRELPHNGVYRLNKDGELVACLQQIKPPNGLAFSPDETTLYIANSDPKRNLWMAFDVVDENSLMSAWFL